MHDNLSVLNAQTNYDNSYQLTMPKVTEETANMQNWFSNSEICHNENYEQNQSQQQNTN